MCMYVNICNAVGICLMFEGAQQLQQRSKDYNETDAGTPDHPDTGSGDGNRESDGQLCSS